MLSWDEEVTSTASLSPTSSRSGPLIAVRFSGPAAPLPDASGKPPSATDGKHRVNTANQHIIKCNRGFFVTVDSLTANNIVQGTYRHFTAPDCRQFLLRQAFEEAIYTHARQYIVESIGLDEGEVFSAYNEIKSIRDKDEFLIPFIEAIMDPQFKTCTPQADQTLLRRATQIGLESLYPNVENPLRWMGEMIDLKKERNFFETRVIEYHSH